MSGATVQMNVRIPAETKTAGDRALSSEGLTPTEVVRCIWEKAAKRGRDLQQVATLVKKADKPADVSSPNPFESAAQMVSMQMLALGVDLSVEEADTPSDNELFEMAYYEKARERGLL